jgi:hypothetical protein
MTVLLFEVQPADPLTLGGMAMLLGVVALLACYLPAAPSATHRPGGSPATRVMLDLGPLKETRRALPGVRSRFHRLGR